MAPMAKLVWRHPSLAWGGASTSTRTYLKACIYTWAVVPPQTTEDR